MATADVLFIAAEPRELAGFLRFCQDVRPVELPVRWSRVARWKDRRVVLIANGAGRARAEAAAKAVTYGTLCSVGYCGALDPALRIGDVLTDPQKLVCLDHVAQTADEKRELRRQGFEAVDMESAGLPKPFYCFKAVTDLADETFANDMNAALLEDGRFSTLRLIAGALKKPSARFPELFRLAARSRIASDKLGESIDSREL